MMVWLPKDKHLLVVTRNATTDSPWPLSTNPKARYNDRLRTDCNLNIPLWQLVRASTAAPIFFPPEEIELAPGRSFVFEDGGVTPYNNPAFLMFRMATEPCYRCDWPAGEDQMMLVSVGTGVSYRTLDKIHRRGETILTSLKTIPGELMRAFAIEQDIACRVVGRCVHGAEIDREVGNLVADFDPNHPKQFLYARYDVQITDDELHKIGVHEFNASDLTLDNVDAIGALQVIGKHAAKQVDLLGHFPAFVPTPAGTP